jgi:hypothetical protein
MMPPRPGPACCLQISGCTAGHGSGQQQQQEALRAGHDSDGDDGHQELTSAHGHQELTSALSQHMGSQEEAVGQLRGDQGPSGAAAGALMGAAGAAGLERAGVLGHGGCLLVAC